MKNSRSPQKSLFDLIRAGERPAQFGRQPEAGDGQDLIQPLQEALRHPWRLGVEPACEIAQKPLGLFGTSHLPDPPQGPPDRGVMLAIEALRPVSRLVNLGAVEKRAEFNDSIRREFFVERGMLGQKNREQLEFFVCGSLRDLAPDARMLARADSVLDLSWLKDEGAHRLGRTDQSLGNQGGAGTAPMREISAVPAPSLHEGLTRFVLQNSMLVSRLTPTAPLGKTCRASCRRARRAVGTTFGIMRFSPRFA